MSWNRILLLLLTLIGIIFLLHIGGTYLHFYWRFEIYDRIVHILAAMWIALSVLAILQKAGLQFTQKRNIIIVGVCATLIIGLFWEFFEYGIGQTSVMDEEFNGDTIGDIISDCIGGLIGSIYGIKYFLVWNNKNQQ